MNVREGFDTPGTAATLSFVTGLGRSDTHAVFLDGNRLNPHSSAGKDYDTITGKEIGKLVREPQDGVPKDRARWFLPTTYHHSDAREHAVQAAFGAFWFLVLDVDKNNLSLQELKAALRAVLGEAATLLIYSSRSATVSERKWRALVPLAGVLEGKDFSDTQLAFFDLLENSTQGELIPDRALARPGQLIFLPNRGEFYEWDIEEGKRLRLTDDHPIIVHRDGERATRAAAEAQARKAREERAAKRKAQAVDGNASVVEHFNARHSIADLLARYGYLQAGGSNDWRSPLQTSKSYATRDYGDHWISLSASDAEVGLGAQAGACRYGDGFDLFVHFEHDGDFSDAVAEYAEEAGIGYASNQYAGGPGFDWNTSANNCGGSDSEDRQKFDDAPPREDPQPRRSRFINGASLKGKPIPPREWLVDDWIPANQVSLFYGDGGTGKSLMAAQLGTAVATGCSWMGLPTKSGRAMYISAEDDDDELHRRYADILRSEGKDFDDFDKFDFMSLAGEDALLATVQKNGTLKPSPLFAEVWQDVTINKPDLVVADTLADFHPANENDRAQARQFIGMMRSIAIKRRCAVVLLAHPSLTGLNSGTGTSGSTAWSNSVRSRFYFERIIADGYESDPDARLLTLKKSNYARTGTQIAVRWINGVFVADQPESSFERMAASSKAERVFLKLLAQFEDEGRRVNAAGGNTYAPTCFAGHPDSEGVLKRAFKTAMDVLLRQGKIVLREDGPASRRRQYLSIA